LASLKASSLEKKRKRRTSGDCSNSVRTAAICPSLASERHLGFGESGSAVDLEHRKISSSTPFFHREVPWSTMRERSRTPPKRKSETATVRMPASVMSRFRRSETAVSRVT
jgi:hypothetical protein